MATTHAMFRADNMAGTTQGKYLVSLRVTADIDNANVVAVGAYEEGAREVKVYAAPETNTAIGKIAILGSEEVDKSVKGNTVGGFTNKKGTIARGYILEHGDVFSATAEAFDKAPTVGATIEVKAGDTKMAVVESASGATVIGTCEAVEMNGNVTWYVVRV